MPLFVLIGRDGTRGAQLRALHRPAHLEHLSPLAEDGRIVFAGPLKGEDGLPRGSVVVFEAANFDAARALVERDPYVVHGVFENVDVFESTQVFPVR